MGRREDQRKPTQPPKRQERVADGDRRSPNERAPKPATRSPSSHHREYTAEERPNEFTNWLYGVALVVGSIFVAGVIAVILQNIGIQYPYDQISAIGGGIAALLVFSSVYYGNRAG